MNFSSKENAIRFLARCQTGPERRKRSNCLGDAIILSCRNYIFHLEAELKFPEHHRWWDEEETWIIQMHYEHFGYTDEIVQRLNYFTKPEASATTEVRTSAPKPA